MNVNACIAQMKLTSGTIDGSLYNIWDIRELQRLDINCFFIGYSLASLLNFFLEQKKTS